MLRVGLVVIVLASVLCAGLVPVSLAMREQTRPSDPPRLSSYRLPYRGPFVLLGQGDTTWVQVHTDTSHCPGDPLFGHGGEATGGPDGSETWCFEQGPGDTCGTNYPWDVLCFDHEDVRALPSPTGVNYWHIDTYRTDEEIYCGTYCLWCGSDSLWDGIPVECGTWVNTPGYGNQWNCIVQLDLGGDFSTINGCTLYFDPRYDTECTYDYFYVDAYTGDEWVTLATFNNSSDNAGATCGPQGLPTPDHFSNTDAGQPYAAGWQGRSNPAEPAFSIALDNTMVPDSDAAFRWRFVSDGAWSDADGRGDTDGAAFIDNVWIHGDPGYQYIETFEHGSWAVLEANGWSLPDPEGVAQTWHILHDPDPPYEGGDGNARSTCTLDSSFVFRARPESGYPGAAEWRNGWHCRLLSPRVPIINTGCVVQYDNYYCELDYTCDYVDTKVRYYSTSYDKWCPWINLDGLLLNGGCYYWSFDVTQDLTQFYGPDADSIQFAWDLMDVSQPTDFCRGKHKSTDDIVDNVSFGFYDGSATVFGGRGVDLLQDTFHDSICFHNSFFDEYDPDTLAAYSGPPYSLSLPWEKQLVVSVFDKDDVLDVRLYGSIDRGASWIYNSMTLGSPADPAHPELGGDYYATFCPADFGLSRWENGTEVWYYVRCEDDLANVAYYPSDANPGEPDHTGGRGDYLSASVFPLYPATYTNTSILLVDGHGQQAYDFAPCVHSLENVVPSERNYEQAIIDVGYCYDKYDIGGAGANVHIHPIDFADHYDCVIWFTGPHTSNYLFDPEAMTALIDYIQSGGKVVICGDRVAYYCCGGVIIPEDSLSFCDGPLGIDYQDEMESPFDKPYIYLQAAASLVVHGTPRAVNYPGFFDSLVVYRECPDLKEMSYVVTTTSPPYDYTAQPLLHVLNPNPLYSPSHGAVYVEHTSGGQCVFINYDLSGFINHATAYCDGDAAGSAPDYQEGLYAGRVELMSTILSDLFGLLIPHFNGGEGGTADVVPASTYRWALAQNSPNPCLSSTLIRFEIAEASRTSLKIYNARGQLVRTLIDEHKQPGRYTETWDGTNSSGRRVAGGVYFYSIQAGRFSATKKMLVIN
jgi:hypothetical protein